MHHQSQISLQLQLVKQVDWWLPRQKDRLLGRYPQTIHLLEQLQVLLLWLLRTNLYLQPKLICRIVLLRIPLRYCLLQIEFLFKQVVQTTYLYSYLFNYKSFQLH